LAVSGLSTPSGSILDHIQHIVAGLAFLAGGVVLVIVAVAPRQFGAVFQFTIRLGRA